MLHEQRSFENVSTLKGEIRNECGGYPVLTERTGLRRGCPESAQVDTDIVGFGD